jgi:hypothetical protein
MWTYIQSSGELLHDGILIGQGYSGFGEGKNNPEMEIVPDVGPIPAGPWAICGPPYDTTEHGPYVLRLEPALGCVVYHRLGFLIHGDGIADPGNASKGCIVMNRIVRSRIWQSGDYQLEVIAKAPAPKAA